MASLLERLVHSTASLGGFGLVAVPLLLALLRWILPPDQRSTLKTPFALFLLHVALLALLLGIPSHWVVHRIVGVVALFFLLTALGRTLFLLLVQALLVRRLARPVPKIFRDIIQALIYAAVLLLTLREAGVEPSSLLTTSALLTAVIGLSLQETLGNMFAGLSIQAQRPFEVGDWIQLDQDERLAGRVMEINWRATRIQTDDAIEMIIPNGALAKAPIRNYTKPTRPARRSVYVLGPYDVSPGRVHAAILPAIREVPGVLRDPAPSVVTRELADSGINYWCRFYTERFGERYAIDGAVRERIWYALLRAGITIPYPTRTTHTHMVSPDDGKARTDDEVLRRVGILDKVDFLQVLSGEDRRELAARSTTKVFGRGEPIIRQGEDSAELFIVDQGEVAVSVRTHNGNMAEVARLGPGKFFGEMSLMTGEQRAATVVAHHESVLLVVSKSGFQDILQRSPELAENISAILSKRQEQLATTSSSIGVDTTPVEGRSSVLLDRIKSFFSL